MSKVIFAGLEGSGKSLRLAMCAVWLVERNKRWHEQTGIIRPIRSNLWFTPEFEQYAASQNVPIYYWQNVDELVSFTGCDVICDEVGTYFDSRLWADLSLDVRAWLSQGQKAGIEFWGTAQDFGQVDKSFRRLCNELYQIDKIIGSSRPAATKPPIKRIWGVCKVRSLNPREYKEDKKEFEKGAVLPSFFMIRREYCEIFDTNRKILRSKPMPFKHVEKVCELHGQGCDFAKTIHA